MKVQKKCLSEADSDGDEAGVVRYIPELVRYSDEITRFADCSRYYNTTVLLVPADLYKVLWGTTTYGKALLVTGAP